VSDGLAVLRSTWTHPLNRSLLERVKAVARVIRWYGGALVGVDAYVTRFVDNCRLVVKRRVAARELYFVRMSEFADMSFVAHLLGEGDTFIDVGANVGAYSVIAAAPGRGRCISFEPVPETYAQLLENVKINAIEKRVDAKNCAVGRQAGFISMTGDRGATNRVMAAPATGKGELIRVRSIALDSLLDEGVEPTVLKIDVEGFETEVIGGSRRLLGSPGLLAVIVELAGHGRDYGFDEAKVRQDLTEHGFRPCRYDPFSRALTVVDESQSSVCVSLYVRNLDAVSRRLRSAKAFTIQGRRI
jgi:FkbM family methyltransferase